MENLSEIGMLECWKIGKLECWNSLGMLKKVTKRILNVHFSFNWKSGMLEFSCNVEESYKEDFECSFQFRNLRSRMT